MRPDLSLYIIVVMETSLFISDLIFADFSVSESAEAGGIIGSVVATDRDNLTAVRYTPRDASVTPFFVFPTTGNVVLLEDNVLDFESGM